MKVVNRFVLKRGGEANGVAKVVRGGDANYVEASSASAFDAVIANVDGEAVAVDEKGVKGTVRGVALFKGGELVASGGEEIEFEPAAESGQAAKVTPVEERKTEREPDGEILREVPPVEEPQQKPRLGEEVGAVPDEEKKINETAAPGAGAEKKEQKQREKGQGEFFRLIEQKLDELFDGREREPKLEALFPDSKWVRVDDGDEAAYVVGVVGEPAKFICYGVPDEDGSAPPKGKEESRQWLPVPGGGGYWMMYQSAEDGSTLTAF